MNALFNFTRIGLLIRRYFIENFRTEIIYWGVVAIFFMFFRNNLPFFEVISIIGGAIYAARFFREIHNPNNGINYFMIPATQLEKITVSLLLTIVYYFAMMIIAYIIGNLTGFFLNNLLANIGFLSDIRLIGPHAVFEHKPLQWLLFNSTDLQLVPWHRYVSSYPVWIWVFFRTFLLIQPVFILGGIYFKRNQLLKTFFSAILIGFILLIVFSIEAKYIWLDWSSSLSWNDEMSMQFNQYRRNLYSVFFNSLYLLPPYFCVVGYFRLKEKQL